MDEGMRLKLQRLIERQILAGTEPGLFALPSSAGSAEDGSKCQPTPTRFTVKEAETTGFDCQTPRLDDKATGFAVKGQFAHGRRERAPKDWNLSGTMSTYNVPENTRSARDSGFRGVRETGSHGSPYPRPTRSCAEARPKEAHLSKPLSEPGAETHHVAGRSRARRGRQTSTGSPRWAPVLVTDSPTPRLRSLLARSPDFRPLTRLVRAQNIDHDRRLAKPAIVMTI